MPSDLVLCGFGGAVDTLNGLSVSGGRYLGSCTGHIRPPVSGSQPLHPGQGERPDRGPDHYRGSVQGETHPEAGATPTQDHGPEEALRSHPGRCHSGGWEDRMDYEASAPTGPCHRFQDEDKAWDVEQGSTLVVSRSGWILLLVPESTG